MSKLIGKAHKAGKKVANFGKPKVLKKLRNGLRKKADKFMASDVGKIVTAAVLIYFGGAALGYWGGGAQAGAGAAGGVAAGGAGGGAGGGAALAAGQTSAASSVVATGGGALDAALAAAVPASATTAATGVSSAGLTALNPALAGAGAGGGVVGGAGGASAALTGAGGAVEAGLAAGGAGASTASGIVQTIRSLGKGALGFAKNNPELTFMGATMLANSLGPTDAEAAAEVEEEAWRRRNRNLAVGGIQLPNTPTPRPLRTLDGQRVWDDDGGLIANFRGKVAAQQGA